MHDDIKTSTKPASGSAKSTEPQGGGDPVQKARQWGGGSQGSKGNVSREDRANEQAGSRS
ncbi:MAG TPA: hypothetical protein VNJ05_04350 [Sphingomicrobium sp.]|nr:hypothetical protein [Sphingomicrobium sp.]